MQYTQSPNPNAQATAYANPQFNGSQASAITSSSSTTTTSQQYTVPPRPQYLQQPSQYLPAAGLIDMGVAYQQSPTTDANHLTQAQYIQNQQPSMVSQSQVSQQVPVLQSQFQHPAMLQQTQQHLPQRHSMASGMQYSDQSQQQQIHRQPPIPQSSQKAPSIDFTQLLESSPAPQQITGNDFSQLMQAAPPIDTSSSVGTTTTTRTETYKGANAGGKARKQAEAKGEKEVQRFERKVQKLIKSICPCPMNAAWYTGLEGYICGEGIHYLYHKDIDKAFAQPGWLPRVTWVNTFNDPEALGSGTWYHVHPPPVAFHEPMHRVHRKFMQDAKKIGDLVLERGEEEDLRKSGCDDECLRGIETVSKAEAHRHLRNNGYNPYATRHAMFN